MDIKEKLANLPDNPGVYIYYDVDGNVLYVGKAKNLKHRVKQYFTPNIDRANVVAMLKHMVDFNYILTPTERDAFSLENTLIKKYMPPYNIMLKDDKQYSYIRINVKADFPKLTVVRKIVNDDAKYFGPLLCAPRAMMELLNSIYPTLNCNHNFDKLPKSFRPCLNYQIGRCPGPCVKAISKEEYKQRIKAIISLLNGDDEIVRKTLTDKMMTASDNMQYEQALIYKEQLDILNKNKKSCVADLSKQVDYDIFTICSNGNNAIVNQTSIRRGKVALSDNHSALDAGIDEIQTLTSFISAFCDGDNDISKEIIVNHPIGSEVEEVLTQRYGKKITILCPQKGIKKRLVNMSYDNAKEKLDKSQAQIDKKYNTTIGACTQLKELLGLNNFPKRIECYDISNISGVDKVASMVVFTNGQKDAKAYRRFKIRTVEGANDFACMEEVLTRRMQHVVNNDIHFGENPDLIVIDGGLGQLNYANRAINNYKGIDLISLAKREELVYTLGSVEPKCLPRNSYSLNLLINIRDEAHRFAITYFRQLHTKAGLKSVLANIEGVGEKRQVELVRHFHNVATISQASVEEIMQVEGINSKIAQNIYDYFNQ